MVSQRNQPFYPIRPQMMFESVSDHFVILQDTKWGKTCVSGLNALFRGTELAKMVSQQNLPLYPIRHQMMFESVSENCVNLQDAKRGKTCVSGLNALFRGTELAKIVSQQNQPFYPIRPRTMFESVSKHFANFQHFKQGKLVFPAWMPNFTVPNLWN